MALLPLISPVGLGFVCRKNEARIYLYSGGVLRFEGWSLDSTDLILKLKFLKKVDLILRLHFSEKVEIHLDCSDT